MNAKHVEWKQRLLQLDTAAVSDAMDSLGINRALFGIAPRVEGAKLAGPAYTVMYEPISETPAAFQNAANYIDDVPAGHVVVIDNGGNTACTNWGDILTRKAVQQQLAGTVINGSARDIETIRALGYPLFTRGIYMVSGKNRVRLKATNVPVEIAGVRIQPGDWLFADDNGVVVVAAERLDEVIARAENVHATEQGIVQAIGAGESLVAARESHGYATPWEQRADAV
ncbi:RraA family protein [Lysobacter yangpyeongensis]|uniref:Putative 4-hydroxy-4-methyl-2-oxoglutarate aldolase n=1 Tax=Lysobacter yangpyeongensis TaxID=346182 RepID=A0ABW0SR67_9GAMM